MNVVFRVDSSHEIGIGHLTRCLTLADALRDRGVNCSFICREHIGNASELVTKKRFELISLPRVINDPTTIPDLPTDSYYESWLGAPCEVDAKETLEKLGDRKFDLLVVDHYGVDLKWEQQLKSAVSFLLVIDDLANRYHLADILVDQTYGVKPEEYLAKVPPHCKLLVGSDFIILRKEFCSNVELVYRKRMAGRKNSSLLISFGGNTNEELFEISINAAIKSELFSKITILIPNSESILRKLTDKYSDCHGLVFKSYSENISELMLDHDLAIGAAGGTAWERCSMGLPSIVIITADNQLKIAKELESLGVIKVLRENISEETLRKNLENWCYSKSDYLNIVEKCLKVCDGQGLERILKNLFGAYLTKVYSLNICKVTTTDCEFIYFLQTQTDSRKYFRCTDIPTWEEHRHWFFMALQDISKELYIIHCNDLKIGVIRLDCQTYNNDEVFEISIIVDRCAQGAGVGSRTLELVLKKWPKRKFIAEINSVNLASRSLFKKSGFTFDGKYYVSKRSQ